MTQAFDPYYEWLGIQHKDQPPHHYRLLGLESFESNASVIERAADRQMAHVRTFQSGEHAAECEKLLNELARARVCLLNPSSKAAYDAKLKDEVAGDSGMNAIHEQPLASPAPAGESAILAAAPPAARKPARKPARMPDKFATPRPAPNVAPAPAKSVAPNPIHPHKRPAPWVAPLVVCAVAVVGMGLILGIAVIVLYQPDELHAIADDVEEDPVIPEKSLPSVQDSPLNENQPINEPPKPSTPANNPPDEPLPDPPVEESKPSLPAVDVPPTQSNGEAPETSGTQQDMPPDRNLPDELPPDGTPIDLLAHIDPRYDAVGGDWKLADGQLLTSDESGAVLQAPIAAPVTYELSAVVTRETPAGELVLGLPLGDTLAPLQLFGDALGAVTLRNKEGQTVGQTGEAIPALGESAAINIRCICRPHRLTVVMDGKPMLDWVGDPRELASVVPLEPKSQQHAMWRVVSGQFRVEQWQLAKVPADWPKVSADTRLAPPEGNELRALLEELRQEYRTPLRNTKAPSERRAAAEVLLQKGRQPSLSPQQAFAHYELARQLSFDAVNLDVALQIVEATNGQFQVDDWEMRAEAFRTAQRSVVNNLQRSQLARAALKHADGAVAEDAFGPAESLLRIAEGIAAKSADQDLRRMVSGRRADWEVSQAAYDKARAAADTLLEQPRDSKANQAVAEYVGFIKRDWPAAEGYFRRAGSAKLAELARCEQNLKDDPADLKALGQAWWEFSKTSESELNHVLQRRALECLVDALPRLSEADQTAVHGLLDEIFKDVPTLAPTPPVNGLKLWLRGDQGVRQQNGLVYLWEDLSGNRNHATQKDPKFCFSYIPGGINLRPVVRSREGTSQCLRFSLPDIAQYEGLTVMFVVNSGESKRGAETVVGVPGPDVIWKMGGWGDSLGSSGDEPFGRGHILETGRSHVVAFRFTRGDGWIVHKNGKSVGRTNEKSFPTAQHGFVLGAYRANDTRYYPFGGDIAEVLIYDHPLTVDDHRQATIYLSLKYALNVPLPDD